MFLLKSVVIFALNTGMRLSEILSLQWRDIAIEQKIIYIVNSKNGERREIPANDIVWRGVRIGKEPVLKTGERQQCPSGFESQSLRHCNQFEPLYLSSKRARV